MNIRREDTLVWIDMGIAMLPVRLDDIVPTTDFKHYTSRHSSFDKEGEGAM